MVRTEHGEGIGITGKAGGGRLLVASNRRATKPVISKASQATGGLLVSSLINTGPRDPGAEQVGLIASMVGKPKIAIIPYETMNGLPLKYDSSPVTTALNGIFVAAPYFLPTIDVRQVMTIKRTQQPALFKKYEAMMETPEAFDPLGSENSALLPTSS